MVFTMEGKEMDKFVLWLTKNKRKNARLYSLVLAFITMEKKAENELVEWGVGKA